MDHDALTRRLRATFAGEVEEQARAISADVLALELRPEDRERLRALFRAAHTLKGAARAAGVPLVERLCHALESRLEELRKGERGLADEDIALLLGAADALAGAVGAIRAGAGLEATRLPDLLSALAPGAPAPPPARPAARPTPRAAAAGESARPAEHLRVDAAKLDDLLAAASDLLIERARHLHGVAEIEAVARDTETLAARWRSAGRAVRTAAERVEVDARVRGTIRALDDETRRLAGRSGRLAQTAARERRRLATAVDRVVLETQELRLRPFAEAVEPLERTVRDLARESGKQARLDVAGADIEADRAVLDALRDALVQLVRNAIDHGVELPEVRERAGKPAAATVSIAAALEGDRIEVTVADDGAGVDADRLRAALAARGREAPADEAALGRALLAGGVSTRAVAGATSGRGVGLDVVRDAVERIQGTVRVEWRAGAGTRFTIECRPSLATLRVVVVAAGTQPLALPTNGVVRLLRLRRTELRVVSGRPVLAAAEGPLPVVSLAAVLGPPLVERSPGDVLLLAVLEHDGRRAAASVDELVAEQEIVLQPMPRSTVAARFVAGATVLGDGRVAPVLDLGAVVDAALAPSAPALAPAATEPERARRRLLVVDDSITTRTLEESLLRAAGYDVATAVDGADAWRHLQERGCDLVVTDVDMPRMDGFDLCRAIRSSKRLRELPVVLVTALETPEHRKRGLEVGADAYVGKSAFDEEQLLETIRQLLR
jgi:two-component system chemotaxis sensor kinase CheA